MNCFLFYTPTNYVIARTGFTLSGAPGTLEISLLLSNTDEDQKVLPSERKAICTVSYGKPVSGDYLTSTKRLEDDLS